MSSSRAEWLRYGAYSLLIVLVVLGGYYFVYVQQHEERLATDRLALLRESAGYFTEEIVRVKANLDNTLNDEDKTERDSILALALEEIEGITHTPVPKDASKPKPEHWSSECSETAGKKETPQLSAQFEPSAHHPHLYFYFAPSEGAGECRLAAANPDSLLRPLLPRSKTAFDQIMLVREDGTVLLSGDSEALSMLEVPLPSHEGKPDADDDNVGTARLRTDLFTIDAAGTSYRVFLQPFRIPVSITYGSDANDGSEGANDSKQETLYLAGLKKDTAFQAEARQLPPTFVFGILGLLGLTLLAFPFLEVWFISPTERFQAHDILEVSVGVVIATAVVTLALLSFFFHSELKDRQFDHLETLALVLQTTLETEADTASTQLARLTRKLDKCTDDKRTPQTCPGDEDYSRMENILDDSSALGGVPQYPHLEMASWINDEGAQVAKWSVREQTTPLIDVPDRGYFRAHAAAIGSDEPTPERGKVWRSPREDSADSADWVLQSIRSHNTGEVFAQLSQEIDLPEEDGPEQDGLCVPEPAREDLSDSTAVVAATTLPLLSLIDPVLPNGYGFALIDDHGEVLFHHDTRRNLRENVFSKVGDSESLREAVRARQAKTLTTRYREDTYQFYSHPVDGSSWTLLVFAELAPIRALQGQILTYTVGLYLSFLLVLFLGLLLWTLLSGRTSPGLEGLFRAVWPGPGKRTRYRRLVKWEGGFVALGFVVLALLIWDPDLSPLTILVGLFVLGASAVGTFCYYCSRPAPSGESQWAPSWAQNYYGSLFLLTLIVGGVLPAGVYCALHDESSELLTKKNQQVFARNLIERGDRIVEKYRHISLSDAAAEKLDEDLFPTDWGAASDSPARPWDVHTVGSSQTLVAVEDSAWGEAAVQPVYGIFSGTPILTLIPWGQTLHVLSDSASSDTTRMWHSTRDAELIFSMRASRRVHPIQQITEQERVPPSESLHIRSSVPTVAALLARSPYQALFLGGLLVIMLIAGWYTVKRLVSQIYFLEAFSVVAAEKNQIPATHDPPSAPPRSLFVRSHRRQHEDRDESIHYIDSAALRQEASPEALAQDADASTADVIVVDNLHDGLDDPECARDKLALLDPLLSLDKAVEVYSDVEPLSLLGPRDRDDASATWPERLLDDWAVLLRNFRRYWDTPGPAAEKASLSSDPDRTDAPLEHLTNECAPDAYLRTEIAPFLADTLELETLSKEQIIEQVRYQAEAHYQHLWRTCTAEEKVVLYRISADGFASPRSQPLVRDLLRRGLLVMDPDLRPMNESFRQFVAALNSPVVAEYDRKSRHKSWSRVQTPLLIGLAAVLAFIFVTQPALAREASTLLPTLAAGLPALLKILSTVFVGHSATSFGNN